ncbi:MAG: cation diffusion facilitator family transporter [Halanaeroarchaeum sp.]
MSDEGACPDVEPGQGHDGHDHGRPESARTLGVVAAINVLGFLAELAGGLLFGSVALLGDAVHMLFDALAYGMAFAAAGVAERYDTSDRWSFGLHRLEPLSAFLNGVLLVPMVAFIVYESYQRFLDPVGIATGPTVALAGAGLLINLLSVYVLQGREMNLNERGAFYHLVGDAGASVAVIVSTLVIEVTGVTVVDPITAVLIASVVLWSAGKLLRGSGEIFLHAAPITRSDVEGRLRTVPGVAAVGDCHTWQVCSEITVATVHVEAAVEDLDGAAALTERIHRELADLGIHHATVELSHETYDRGFTLQSHAHGD